MEEQFYFGKFCGREIPPLLVVKTTPLYVYFHSDNSVGGQGFSAIYLFTGTLRPRIHIYANLIAIHIRKQTQASSQTSHYILACTWKQALWKYLCRLRISRTWISGLGQGHDENSKPCFVFYVIILNAKNLAPLSNSIFSGSKVITSNFSIIQKMCPCRKIIFVTNSNAWEWCWVLPAGGCWKLSSDKREVFFLFIAIYCLISTQTYCNSDLKVLAINFCIFF